MGQKGASSPLLPSPGGAPEAVDNYLKLFHRVLLLKYYRVPVSAMIRITGHSKTLLEEHLALVEKHFPNEEALATYLGQRSITWKKGVITIPGLRVLYLGRLVWYYIT